MGKSRKTGGRVTRLGWALALVLLITPGHAIAGSEWTMQGSEPEGVEWTLQGSEPEGVEWTQQAGDDRVLRGDRTLNGLESWTGGASPARSPDPLRGSEWT